SPPGGTPRSGAAGGAAGKAGRAAAPPAGLALRPLLLLRLRRLCRALGMAAALSDRGLRPRHPDRGGDRYCLLAACRAASRVRRDSFRSLRRPQSDALVIYRLA